MKLCVGATSRRVVEEAASLRVHQIVASRRQVNASGGYIGMSPREFVDVVKDRSRGETQVVRDHGGPGQGGFNDDGTTAFDVDVAAGFDGLHLDVSALPVQRQHVALISLVETYAEQVQFLEVGGEHETFEDNLGLIEVARKAVHTGSIACVVAPAGTFVWADRQCGSLVEPSVLASQCSRLAGGTGTCIKLHNADFIGDRHNRYERYIDQYNIAPELGVVETDAILTCLEPAHARQYLDLAYRTVDWARWFHAGEGTWYERARCAMRYQHVQPTLDAAGESFVRERIRDAITCG